MAPETLDETRTPMSWEDHEALEDVRGEYVGGQLGPDLIVHRSDEDTRLTTSVPLLVVEVRSSHRRTDLRDVTFHVAAVHTAGVVTASYGGVDVGLNVDALLR